MLLLRDSQQARFRMLAAGCLLLAALGPRHILAESRTLHQVAIESGQLPLILSAPHGGSEAIADVPERTGEGAARFQKVQDANTDQLAEALADAIEKKLGKRPYVVIARFHRKYVDANRPAADAYESPQAKVVYETYHQALAQARQEVIRNWGRGILLDIHGQALQPETIFRGTQNGQTVSHLTRRFGLEALTGKTSLFGILDSLGVRVMPAVQSNDPEHPGYSGGYIVGTYGSRAGGTLDAIQLELGRDLRSDHAATADRLAQAIVVFASKYLPQSPVQNDQAPAADKKVRVGDCRDAGAVSSASARTQR